jgi:phosphohistidine phosphatase
MITLYVLRHGLAVEHGAPGYDAGNDDARPLTAKGIREMRRIGQALRRLKVQADVMLSSPLPRAWRTAEIVAGALRRSRKLKSCVGLGVSGDPRVVFRRLKLRHASAKHIMLVGHEPYLSQLISVLLTGEKDLPLTLKKGGLGKLSLPRLRYGRGATLEWLLTPKTLAKR